MLAGNSHGLENLRRYLRGIAPTGDVRGRSQSRRLEGQLSSSTEEDFFTSVAILVQPGVGRFPEVVQEVLLAVAKLQYDALRGTPFPLTVRAFPGSGSVLANERLRDHRGAKRLADQIVQLAGIDVVPGTAVIDSLGRPDSARLDVVFCLSRDVEVHGEALVQLQTRPQVRTLWVLPSEQVFLSPARVGAAPDPGVPEEP